MIYEAKKIAKKAYLYIYVNGWWLRLDANMNNKKTLLPQLWLHSYIFHVSFHFASVSTYFAYFSLCSPLSFSFNFNLLYAIIVSSSAILFFYFVDFVFSSPTTARIYSMAEYQDLWDSLTRKNIADLLARFKDLRTFFPLSLFTLIYMVVIDARCKCTWSLNVTPDSQWHLTNNTDYSL